MKIASIPLILILLLFSAQWSIGQDKPQVVLMDEFPKIGSEDFSARIDTFINYLADNQDVQGYFVIHPGSDSEKSGFRSERWYEQFTKELISTRKFDKNRIKIVRSDDSDATKFQLWKVTPGAEIPFSIKEKWIVPSLDLSKPLIFTATYEMGLFQSFIPEFYADYINNNENVYGHLVMFYGSRKTNREAANKWIKVLTEEYGVPRNRLKVFYAKTGTSVRNEKDNPVYEEFWLVPKRKK